MSNHAPSPGLVPRASRSPSPLPPWEPLSPPSPPPTPTPLLRLPPPPQPSLPLLPLPAQPAATTSPPRSVSPMPPVDAERGRRSPDPDTPACDANHPPLPLPRLLHSELTAPVIPEAGGRPTLSRLLWAA
eukprot:gene346-11153_t